MARYAYDVNKTQRLIDVHKQFSGGLKTVDTDDALGAVFLRDAENVSLSEFGFLEKRYGTYKNFSIEDGVTANSKLQGFWEFYPGNTLYQIMAIDGNFYVNGEKIITIYEEEEEDYRYPNLTSSFAWTKLTGKWTNVSFQKTKEIGGVVKNDFVYFFTGTYPIYAREVSVSSGEIDDQGLPIQVEELRFFAMPVTVPTYDEIVVVGHNLLENDYDGLYFSNESKLTQPSQDYNPGFSYPEILQNDYFPKFPNTEGDVNFDFVTFYPQDMNAFSKLSPNNYFEIKLDSVGYRTYGSGASDLDFLEADISGVDFQPKSNYLRPLNYNALEDDLQTIGATLISLENFSKTDVKQTTISGDYNRRGEYRLTLNFELTRKDFLDSEQHLIQLYRYNGIDWIPFVLKDGLILDDYVYPFGFGQYREVTLKITPVDFNDNVLKKETVTLSLYSQNEYTFSAPDNLNKNTTISKYLFEFFAKDAEIWDTETGAIGPYDLESNPENYYFDVVNTAYKKPVSSGNNITASSVPTLDFKLSNLINGTFDFKVRFVREEYVPVFINGQFVRIELLQKEFFETIIKEVVITSEQIQDYPGAKDVPLKLEALWSCNRVVEHFGKLMVWGSEKMPNSIFYSFPDRPSFFPSKFYLDFGSEASDPVMAITPYMNILVVQTLNTTWGVRGNSGYLDSPAPYIPFSINSTVGTIAPNSVRPVRNHLFFLSKQGIIALKSLYAADEQYNIDFVDRNIRNIVPQDSQAVGIQYDNQYWLNFPEQRITLRWYIDKKAWVLDKYNAWDSFNGVFKYQIVNGQLEFITRPSRFESDGNLKVYKIGVDYSLPSDLGGTVISKFETSFLNQNYPFHLKNYKEFKYDFTMQNEYNASRAPVYSKVLTIDGTYTNLDLEGGNVLKRNHYYRISFLTSMPVETIQIGTTLLEFTPVSESYYEDGYTDFEFLIPADFDNVTSLYMTFSENPNYADDVHITDITYDNIMTFLTKVISEERNVLNQQLPIGYDESQEELEVDLSDFEDFTLGSSYFGDRVTFVKTIKLSGRGYNSKTYFEDFSKSKWTIESMGITYKMKKARST